MPSYFQHYKQICSESKFYRLIQNFNQQAVEMNCRRAFSESNIGGWDYLRNMVQLPFYLQNSALRRVKTAQQTAARRIQAIGTDDFSTSLQRSVSVGSNKKLNYNFLYLKKKLAALSVRLSVRTCGS